MLAGDLRPQMVGCFFCNALFALIGIRFYEFATFNILYVGAGAVQCWAATNTRSAGGTARRIVTFLMQLALACYMSTILVDCLAPGAEQLVTVAR
ncbi:MULTISPECIES: hypothetical protein [unclassified Sinorhizobium]|uniref:hypothetical protein n=1 Tax=unclassified Sinorhizobium TaxID=2613772 RepID=UPI003525BDDC